MQITGHFRAKSLNIYHLYNKSKKSTEAILVKVRSSYAFLNEVLVHFQCYKSAI